jgi:hypothetical protein
MMANDPSQTYGWGGIAGQHPLLAAAWQGGGIQHPLLVGSPAVPIWRGHSVGRFSRRRHCSLSLVAAFSTRFSR